MPWASRLPCQIACGWVGSLTSIAVIEGVRGARGVERLAVRREAALVAERRDQRGRVQHRVPAVGVHVVDREQSRLGGRVAVDRGQQAARPVEVQRLVRGHHRRLGERVGLHRMGRVAHVQHRHAERRAGRVDRVGREQQRRVVERAHMALDVDVAKHLEAARGALMGDLLQVAPQPVVARIRPAHGRRPRAPGASRGRTWPRGGHQRRLGPVGDRRLGGVCPRPGPSWPRSLLPPPRPGIVTAPAADSAPRTATVTTTSAPKIRMRRLPALLNIAKLLPDRTEA